ncbi:beta-galactosidase [Kribbella flavida DSM 17836]|uniref:Beta-glucosidase n=1 Tax=Kribbella flavida (strain DSM 17836 / JCM 10339 / NBRC 14399) TaxID=479435 RepID=D2PL35_KRIFD|nr:GH1 family beta-glucosidase [Kribbella flavida]ADB34290.1 beta-galactosidase [Kribbella flavida DSM 17836]
MNTTAAPSTSTEAALIAGLPAGFRWGVATSAYQIEGAVDADGRTPSIWDTFCRVPGAVHNGENGDVACEHYTRMPDDVALIKDLGLDTYRFSVSWPRVQPRGTGGVNPAGIAFYDRLVDELLASGIDPWVTLYHWDLPQELEDAGGWPARDTAYRFADYSMLVFDALSDRVDTWTTLNEPWCSAMLGYAYGAHAPGKQDFPAAVAAVHHLLLGHGLATERMREAAPRKLDIGITLNAATAYPASDAEPDLEAARRADGMGARLYLDPLVHGRYPADVIADLAAQGAELPVQDGDLATISAPIDVLGINYYFSQQFTGYAEDGRTVGEDGLPISRTLPLNRPRTAMDWEIVPEGFTDLLVRISRDYPGLPMVVTENGAAFDDEPDENGFVADDGRTAYFTAHLAAVASAIEQGADIRGYLAWSLLDNFEWAYGYEKRFGIVRVDYGTQARTPKQSALYLKDLAEQHRRR